MGESRDEIGSIEPRRPVIEKALRSTKRVYGMRAWGISRRNTVMQERSPKQRDFREELGRRFREDEKKRRNFPGVTYHIGQMSGPTGGFGKERAHR